MPILCWRDQFETGLEPIDGQHRELLEALDRLAEAVRSGIPGPEVDEALAGVTRHTIKHCQAEETLMKDRDFPDRVAHASQHLDLILRMRDLQYRRVKGQTLGLDAVASLAEWLEQHLCGADRAYVDHLKAHPAP